MNIIFGSSCTMQVFPYFHSPFTENPLILSQFNIILIKCIILNIIAYPYLLMLVVRKTFSSVKFKASFFVHIFLSEVVPFNFVKGSRVRTM